MMALIYDTETTGLIHNRSIALSKQPEIVEFCAYFCDLKRRVIKWKYQTLIRPSEFPVPDAVKRETKTKLTDDDLREAPKFREVAGYIKNVIEQSPVLIAHNAAFDREMLEVEFERLTWGVNFPPSICTIEQTIQLQGKRLTLTALHTAIFGEGFNDAHRAEGDVKALFKCCCELYKRRLL